MLQMNGALGFLQTIMFWFMMFVRSPVVSYGMLEMFYAIGRTVMSAHHFRVQHMMVEFY